MPVVAEGNSPGSRFLGLLPVGRFSDDGDDEKS